MSDPATPPCWENPVKRLLREDQPVLGITLTAANLDTAAQAARLGFDFLWIEMEHSPITLETLRNMVLATRGLGAVPFARVPVNETWMAKRVLDQGVCGVIFPFTSTPELARRAAAACCYPPRGARGSGAGLAMCTWPDPETYYDSADRNVVVVAVVEEARAVESIEEIAATPGIDVLFIGTSDLSFSLGLRGDQDHPKLHEAIARIVDAARRNGKAAGRPAATSEKVCEYLRQGFRFFQSGTELGLMVAGARPYLEPLGKFRLRSKGKALY